MNYMANAKFYLSICSKCFGCNKIENLNFTGVQKCSNYREAKGIEEVERWQQQKINLLGKGCG